ncbi:MAG: acetyl-CoA carboxylase subunit alpha/beta, partial [Actinomycetota bacterium]|nr:acetyl-CoA carboxylase subunit alpha/beta [Actinomycetota bacterium]
AELADRLGIPLLTLVDTPGADPRQAAEDDGLAPAIGAALDAVLACRSPTVALVHGEGGSGGAIAAAATDRVLVTPEAYFIALGPEGAAAALRLPADEAADRMAITPADLRRLGFADALVPAPASATAAGLRRTVADAVGLLSAQPAAERLTTRRRRWTAPLPGGR